MKPAPILTPTWRYIACPECGKGEFRVDHILGKADYRFGTWYCHDCGAGFDGTTNAAGEILTQPAKDRYVSTRCLVRLKPDVANLFFEVEHFAIGRPIGVEKAGRYWFEEGTCVLNFLRHGRETWEGDDHDPHGIFEILEERPVPTQPREFPGGNDPAAFSQEDIRGWMGRSPADHDAFDQPEGEGN